MLGRALNSRDMARLLNLAVRKGLSRKFHKLGTGLFLELRQQGVVHMWSDHISKEKRVICGRQPIEILNLWLWDGPTLRKSTLDNKWETLRLIDEPTIDHQQVRAPNPRRSSYCRVSGIFCHWAQGREFILPFPVAPRQWLRLFR